MPSASVLRYRLRGDDNDALRSRLKELAGQHRRYGYWMLHNRLCNDSWTINVKRTYRLYREEGLTVRRRRRKKLPVPERQPLVCGRVCPMRYGAWISYLTSWPVVGVSKH